MMRTIEEYRVSVLMQMEFAELSHYQSRDRIAIKSITLHLFPASDNNCLKISIIEERLYLSYI